MQRDGPLFTADSVMLYIDPGQTRRNAYNFEIGASGGRTDQLELNNTEELREWDTIWEGQARIVEDGWIAEIAIPFKSLSYEPSQTDVGLRCRTPHPPQERTCRVVRLQSVARFHRCQPVRRPRRHRERHARPRPRRAGLRRVPRQARLAARRRRRGAPFTAGGNAFYKVTPALTNTLTVNPDFSDSPLDLRQVNTTRFSLFTPETRDFFLQDVAAFEFGGRSFGRNSQDRVSNNGRPFFSRNIGLVRGRPVSLIVGDKLSGEFGGFNIGALAVLTDKTPTGEGGEILSIARVTHPIFAESKFGFIVTNGDPTGLTSNTVAGVDFQYRNSNFFGGDKILQADVYYMKSFSSKEGDDDTAAFALNFPNEPWFGDFLFKQIGESFLPALGFINRTAIRQYVGTVAHLSRYRNTYLNQLEFGTNIEFVTDLHDRLELRAHDIYVRAASRIGDEITVKFVNSHENVPVPFFLPNNVPVFGGSYEWNNFNARLRTFDGRIFRLDAEVTCCSFYNGSQFKTRVQLAFRPGPIFEFVPTYEGTYIDLPTGKVDIHLVTVDSVVNFLPDMQLALQAQYDNISENFGFSARYRWEYAPGDELFVAIGQSAMIGNQGFIAQTTQATVRLGQTFRF